MATWVMWLKKMAVASVAVGTLTMGTAGVAGAAHAAKPYGRETKVFSCKQVSAQLGRQGRNLATIDKHIAAFTVKETQATAANNTARAKFWGHLITKSQAREAKIKANSKHAARMAKLAQRYSLKCPGVGA